MRLSGVGSGDVCAREKARGPEGCGCVLCHVCMHCGGCAPESRVGAVRVKGVTPSLNLS